MSDTAKRRRSDPARRLSYLPVTGVIVTDREGKPIPLGASWSPTDGCANFALYSSEATAVELLLYGDADFTRPLQAIQLAHPNNKSQRVWHWATDLANIKAARYYAYRVDGERPSGTGQRFDPNKILLDPFAIAVFLPGAFDRMAAVCPGPNDGRAPLGILPWTVSKFDWENDVAPGVTTSELIIYELHVRGFTKRTNSPAQSSHRGTFAGISDLIPYLQELGITAVELMPVFQFDQTEPNYWGYMPINFFSPHAAYAGVEDSGEQINQFKMMVRELHRAGILVVLDVVYNHSGEGSEAGPTYSFRGIDNGTYYTLTSDLMHYWDATGTGNMLRTTHPAVRDLIMASLRYWADEMHVDGFRFDLATVFTREASGEEKPQNAPIIGQIESDPMLREKLLIAEAWDAGGANQLGRSFPGVTWLQWNGKYRDCLRAFIKSDVGLRNEAILRVYGSDDLFPDDRYNACRPFQSVNYLASHDGFNLCDAVSYNHRRNHANGHNNEDGPAPDHSWNCGWEGDEGVPADVLALRHRQVKNFFAVLLSSNGVPMFRAGDEFLNTQRGNNNPYNQDNHTSWLDWDRLRRHAEIYRFVRGMIAMRKSLPQLGCGRFWHDKVLWHHPKGNPSTAAFEHAFGFTVDGEESSAAILVSAYWEPVDFALSPPARGGGWRRAADTSLRPPDDIAQPWLEMALVQGPIDYRLGPRSVVILVSRSEVA